MSARNASVHDRAQNAPTSPVTNTSEIPGVSERKLPVGITSVYNSEIARNRRSTTPAEPPRSNNVSLTAPPATTASTPPTVRAITSLHRSGACRCHRRRGILTRSAAHRATNTEVSASGVRPVAAANSPHPMNDISPRKIAATTMTRTIARANCGPLRSVVATRSVGCTSAARAND